MKETRAKYKALTASASIITFILTNYLFIYTLTAFKVNLNISAVLSIVAGAFSAYIVMALSGVIKEFSIKSGFVQISSKLEEKIENVKNDLSESKRDIGEKISGLNTSLQSVNSTLDSIMLHISTTAVHQTTTLNFGDLINEAGLKIQEEKSKKMNSAGITKELDPTKVSLSREVEHDIQQFIELQKKIEELQQLTKKLKLTPFNIDKLIQDANFHFYKGEYEKASELYDQILKEDPKNVYALVNKAITLYRLGKYEDALSYCDRSLAIDRNNFDALVYKSFILYRAGKLESAIPYYKRISNLDIDENSIDALVNKGVALVHLSKYEEAKYEEARAYFQKATKLEINPNNFDALVGKGVALEFIGKYEDAQSYYDRALGVNPDGIFAMYSKARCYVLQGKLNESLNLVEKIYALKSEYKEVKTDPDFNKIRTYERFRKLTEE
jgi:tetratricopeptide (TPR) repeat protein